MIDQVHEYYCTPRAVTSDGPERSIYEIWEEGGAFNDSVTPSTYCAEYRSHMVLKILSLARQHHKLFSIGCGNAFVEAGVVAAGVRVRAIDCNAEAVEYAISKGVNASAADYFSLPSGHLASFDIVYADGLLGHLYRPGEGLDRFFVTLQALKPRPGGWVVVSNDAPLNGNQDAEPHARVSGFWLLSNGYLARTLAQFGFDVAESYHFPYLRPISGVRNRSICVARVAAPDKPSR